MIAFVIVIHLIFPNGDNKEFHRDYIGASLESCMDYGRNEVEILHKEFPDSTSAMHFCIKKDERS